MSAVVGLILPGLPHPLLQPEGNPSWGEIRKGFEACSSATHRCED